VQVSASEVRAATFDQMNQQFGQLLYLISIWALPVIVAITFHEAAHGFVARLCGDDTAWRLGRVTFNPLKHIDPIGTILLPAALIFLRSPFLFGYAKPVPVNFGALHNPRRDMVLVAAAGPGINIVLAATAALLFHLVDYLPDTTAQWVAANLKNALIINFILAVFNLLPLPPLDGGRIVVGLLPDRISRPLARLEPYGIMILIGVLFVLPVIGAQIGLDFSIVSRALAAVINGLVRVILRLTGYS
jgi:Zn-dependent protease